MKPPKRFHFAGYIMTNEDGLTIHRDYVDLKTEKDYGCDPLGDGMFRMIPSGDVVDYDEMQKRLNN